MWVHEKQYKQVFSKQKSYSKCIVPDCLYQMITQTTDVKNDLSTTAIIQCVLLALSMKAV